MKKITFALLCIGILQFACDTKIILIPIPNTYGFNFQVYLEEGFTEYADSDTLTAQDVLDAIEANLSDDLTLADVKNHAIESLSYELLYVDQSHAIFTGDFVMTYGEYQPVTLLSLENAVVGELVGNPQTTTFNESTVDLLQTALQEILDGNNESRIVVNAQGNVSHLVRSFEIQVSVTISHVVEQMIDVPDPL